MKSHSCEKPIGGGVSPTPEPIFQAATPNSVTCEPVTCEPVTCEPATTSAALTRCRHIDRLRRQCRLFSTIPDSELCPHHTRLLRKQEQRHNDEDAAELLRDVEDFSTPEAVNALLGNLVRQLARKRISRLDAIAIAYVSQLLLGSISSMDRHDAALRAADNSDHDFPSRIIFDRPDGIDPTAEPVSDSMRFASSFTSAHTTGPQNPEGRA